MSFIEERKVLTREKRLSTLSHYNGTIKDLTDKTEGTEIKQRIRTLTQSTYDEILFALTALSGIRDAAVVIHGAVGCGASGLYHNRSGKLKWYSTNLNERDTILGGDDKLRSAVIRAVEEDHAKLVFIVGTPVVAINNDDVNSIVLELEDELGVDIISIYTDGFKTKTPVSGYDIVLHALLRHVVAKEGTQKKTQNGYDKERDFINVVTVSENIENIQSIVKILEDLEIRYQLLPQFADIDGIKNAVNARATVVINPDEEGLFAKELEESFGVPYVRTSVPIGTRGTRHFIERLSKELGIVDKGEAYIKEHADRVDPVIHSMPLAGRSVFLDINLANAIHFVDLIERLGGTVSGLAIPYIDLENRASLSKLKNLPGNLPVIVGNGQQFEKANVLAKKPADYFISLRSQTAFAASRGSIPVSVAHTAILGYEGITQFVKQLNNAQINPYIQRRRLLAAEGAQEDYVVGEDAIFYRTGYKDSWLKKSSNWYVKQEVK